ncbi:SDR family oxidoreductase [Ectobacillus antri]|jgi:NAD(P)-dependent dehydrogenase (short-subunit alcohol dehydrogenase family)|uniref:SDR family oxidoreductase n=1 Tax=Ectobacillus antri TaxID=2486280 RepID=A0ABT6H8Q1_9BACI|nr:SDR family oxidoreductase [Ectobacillus antri]MDG4658163.1 SDR family oxidoreductase [Ectobacillus antri]MDG5755243.1 SDR family oxidoreductase [Ectobacillus antri]
MANKKQIQPPQHQQKQPGIESLMNPLPQFDQGYTGSGKLQGKYALITGGDSGIGRAVAVAFAKEGAHVAIAYLDEHEDANETKRIVESQGVKCLLLAGDLSEETQCKNIVAQTVSQLGGLNILVNNIAQHYPCQNLLELTADQWEKTFKINVFSYFCTTKAALPHMKAGDAIINTTSITAYEGNEQLLDYSSTKGAIVTFTKSLAKSLMKQGIRVNGVAPGPIWTPLIPASFDSKKVSEFGSDSPMGRPGQPYELAPAYVYLASADSSYVSGQMLHVNGGTIIG